MKIITPFLFLIAVASCATSEAKTPDDLSVVLASVTLADQCPTSTPPPPVVPAPPKNGFAKPPPANQKAPITRSQDAQQDQEPEKPSSVPAQRRAPSAGACAPGANCSGPRRHCEQTSMQLTLTPAIDLKSSVKIKKVELLDKTGKVVQTLTASAPTQWSVTAGAYLQWNEKIGKDAVRASYNLSSPDWNKLTGGRFNAPSHTFQLRVVVTVGGADRTVEKTAIVPARVEPMVVT